MAKTTDNHTYYNRTGTNKKTFIKDFVNGKNDEIQFIYDVGCNNGEMSKDFISDKRVVGVDLSEELSIPKGIEYYNYDVVSDNKIYFPDLTLFLSLYHHILGNYGLKKADDIFYKLLLRTKYLIFDTGNLSENHRKSSYWYNEQRNHFNNEKELLDHFNIKYELLGKWKTGGGERSVVIFHKSDFDEKVEIVEKYKRLVSSELQKKGLIPKEKWDDEKYIYDGVLFYKLKFKKNYFFAKKWQNDIIEYINPANNKETEQQIKSKNEELKELSNISKAYENIDSNKLINFYGRSNKFGIIFEWLDNINWIKKSNLEEIDVDKVDVVKHKGKEYFIDFHGDKLN